MAGNGSGLYEGGELKHKTMLEERNLIQPQTLIRCTKPPPSYRPCYVSVKNFFFFFREGKSLNHSFIYSQAKPKEGLYFLTNIELAKIDVVFKGISKRDFFNWDKNIDKHIETIKSNFENEPPIILEELEDKYYSIDGHHRIVSAIELQKINIIAYVLRVDKLTHPRSNN